MDWNEDDDDDCGADGDFCSVLCDASIGSLEEVVVVMYVEKMCDANKTSLLRLQQL